MRERLKKIFELIDHENNQDPNTEVFQGVEYKKEYLYGLRMTEQLNAFNPITTEVVKIACRAQHIRRWDLKRSAYTDGRAGYLRWRKDQGQHHALVTANLMEQAGYSIGEIDTTKKIIMKKNIKSNQDSQNLEDTACLVFLKYYFTEFITNHEGDKLKNIIIKTWEKMSKEAQQFALKHPFPKDQLQIIQEALE